MPSLLDVQIDFLKQELETVNTSIRQMDDITKNVKQWTIVLWTAAVGGALAKPELSGYVWVTAAIPLLFWFVDTWHRRIQRKFIWRGMQISDFLNDGRLSRSIDAQAFHGFKLWDPMCRLTTRDDNEHQQFIDWKRIMFFRSLALLYIGLIIFSFAATVMVAIRAGNVLPEARIPQ